jgi:acyl carrier protein
MQDKIIAAIADQLNIDKETVTLESRLIEDLRADSLDVVAMIMEVEQEFDIQIPDEDMLTLRTVGDIVTYLKDKV